MPPGVYVAAPSVLVSASETFEASASLSVPKAAKPVGASVAATMLTSGFAVKPAANATGTVKTSVLPGPASTRAPVAPKLVCPTVPVTVPQLDVPLATHVAFAVSVTPGGKGSLTVTSNASDGPLLAIVTVYVAVPPGVYTALPSVLVTVSTSVASSVSLSEPLAVIPLARSVAVAVLISGSVVMPAANATGTVNTIALPAPASTRAAVAPKLG